VPEPEDRIRLVEFVKFLLAGRTRGRHTREVRVWKLHCDFDPRLDQRYTHYTASFDGRKIKGIVFGWYSGRIPSFKTRIVSTDVKRVIVIGGYPMLSTWFRVFLADGQETKTTC
jgi:hypothetical protein